MRYQKKIPMFIIMDEVAPSETHFVKKWILSDSSPQKSKIHIYATENGSCKTAQKKSVDYVYFYT